MKTSLKTAYSFALSVTLAAAGFGTGTSNVDPAHRFGWGENVGHLSWQHDTPNPGDGVTVTPTYLAGFVWAQSVGWINLGDGDAPYENDPADSSAFGVNVEPDTGELFGLAWGENIGWVNFDTRNTQGPHDQQARLDFCNNRFRGYAWAENTGWINLDDPEHFVGLGPDCQTGDAACAGQIGLFEYGKFQAAVTGPGQTSDCPLFDFDGDLDVDLHDFGAFQAEFNEQQ